METKLITYAIPFFFALIGIELLYSILSKKGLYRLHDSISNLSTGVGNQIAGLSWPLHMDFLSSSCRGGL